MIAYIFTTLPTTELLKIDKMQVNIRKTQQSDCMRFKHIFFTGSINSPPRIKKCSRNKILKIPHSEQAVSRSRNNSVRTKFKLRQDGEKTQLGHSLNLVLTNYN